MGTLGFNGGADGEEPCFRLGAGKGRLYFNIIRVAERGALECVVPKIDIGAGKDRWQLDVTGCGEQWDGDWTWKNLRSRHVSQPCGETLLNESGW